MTIFNFFAEIPWYIPAALFLVSAVLFYTGNARMDKPMKRIAFAGALVAIALSAVSWLLDSDQEIVRRNTRNLVRAVEQRNWNRMQQYLYPKAQAFVFKDRDAIISGCRFGAERIELQSVAITSLSLTPNDGSLVAVIQVYSDSKQTSTVLTNWELEWDKLDGVWQVTEIRALGGPGVPVDAIANWIQRGR